MKTAKLCLGALALGLASLSTLAAELKLPRDGWASWEVPAVDKAPASCCSQGSDSVGIPHRAQLTPGMPLRVAHSSGASRQGRSRSQTRCTVSSAS